MNKTREEQLRNAEKREATSESRVRELQKTAEQLRSREQLLEKLRLEGQLQKEHKAALKWKRQAIQWKHHITKKRKVASEGAAAPENPQGRRQAL
jgi:hypothetical protein